MLGFGSAGMWTAKPFLDAGERVIVVEDDAVICKQLSRNNLRFLRGDGADPDVLKTTGAPKAKLIIASMRRVRDALVVIRLVSDQVPVMVKVFEEHERELIENAGGIAVMNSKATADTFMEWLDAHHATPS